MLVPSASGSSPELWLPALATSALSNSFRMRQLWYVLASCPPKGTSFTSGVNAGYALSADGTRLAFTTQSVEGKTSLWVRPLNSLSAQELTGRRKRQFPLSGRRTAAGLISLPTESGCRIFLKSTTGLYFSARRN
jgi:hypothetical protein